MNLLKSTLLFFTLLFSFEVFAQQGNIVVNQDTRLKQLMDKGVHLFNDNLPNNAYTVQIFNGEVGGAQAALRTYRRNFSDWPASLEYEAPNYKVWAGSFLSRFEADRALLQIKNQFPHAFILRPERRN